MSTEFFRWETDLKEEFSMIKLQSRCSYVRLDVKHFWNPIFFTRLNFRNFLWSQQSHKLEGYFLNSTSLIELIPENILRPFFCNRDLEVWKLHKFPFLYKVSWRKPRNLFACTDQGLEFFRLSYLINKYRSKQFWMDQMEVSPQFFSSSIGQWKR